MRKKTDRAIALQTKWFTIIKKVITSPSGKTNHVYVHEEPDSALCVCVTDDNTILIESQYRPAIGRISIDYPAGGMEKHDATIEETILRELEEETGFKPRSLKKLMTVDKNPAFSSGKMHIFLAKGLIQGKPHPDETEAITFRFVEPLEIMRLIASGEMACTFCVTATFLAFQELKIISFDQMP